MAKTSAVKTKKAAHKAHKTRKGMQYVCGTCGMAVTVDKDCGCEETCELLCCDKPMRAKK